MPIIALSEAKKYLRIPATFCEDDDFLEIIIPGCEKMIEDYLRTAILVRQFAQQFDGGEHLWILDYRPVVSIVSILDPKGNSIDPDRYLLRKELGQIQAYHYFPRAVRTDGSRDRWTVTYTAGHFATAGAVSESIRLGILQMIAHRFFQPQPGVQGMTMGKSSISMIPNPTASTILPQEVVATLGSWRRPTV